MSVRDSQLLARYLDASDEAAFSQLVADYGGLVLGAARRVTGETEAAKEAAQNTFIMLARKAPGLRGRESLGGWLHHTAMLSARNIVRSRRREERKRAALKEAIDSDAANADAVWEAMRPVLDDSLSALPELDRDALVLRFYRGCSVQEVASTMKVSLAAAQKRLGRALEKLRDKFQRQGVTLSVPALGAGLGLWLGKSPCAAALTAAWATKAATASGTAGSSMIGSTILTNMTKSKIATTIVVAALLIAGGAIGLKNLNKPEDDPSGPTSAGETTKSSPVARPARSDSANRMRELEAKFGSDRVRQARRIVNLLQAGYRSQLDKSMAGLDAMTSEWVRQKAEAWGLDAARARDLSLVVLAEQDGRIRKYKDAFHALGEDRTAACAEAVLLADQVASGELDRDEFETAHERLSEMDSGRLHMQMWSPFPIEAYFLDEDFTSKVEKSLPQDRQATFRKEIEQSNQMLVQMQINALRMRVPDLSPQQLEKLDEFVRKVGPFPPERMVVEEFLTEEQNDAWREKEQERHRQTEQMLANLRNAGVGGTSPIADAPPMRTPTDGQVPLYPWQEPMPLDAAEAEAREISRDGAFSRSTEPIFDDAPRRDVGPVRAWPEGDETPEVRAE